MINIFEELKRSTKGIRNEIINFVNKMSIDELKQKGIVNQIVTQFNDGKPRQVLEGGMKRSHADVDQPKTSFS